MLLACVWWFWRRCFARRRKTKQSSCCSKLFMRFLSFSIFFCSLSVSRVIVVWFKENHQQKAKAQQELYSNDELFVCCYCRCASFMLKYSWSIITHNNKQKKLKVLFFESEAAWSYFHVLSFPSAVLIASLITITVCSVHVFNCYCLELPCVLNIFTSSSTQISVFVHARLSMFFSRSQSRLSPTSISPRCRKHYI